jgi:hypothetical protein
MVSFSGCWILRISAERILVLNAMCVSMLKPLGESVYFPHSVVGLMSLVLRRSERPEADIMNRY